MGLDKTFPSFIPSLFTKDPVATFLTTTSIGIISSFLTNCSLIFSLFIKWFGTLISDNLDISNSEIKLFKTPFPGIIDFFLLLNAVASSLKY